jgi:hypothetical protein
MTASRTEGRELFGGLVERFAVSRSDVHLASSSNVAFSTIRRVGQAGKQVPAEIM